MIEATELRRMSEAKLADAIALRNAGRYDAAMYLCGYAVELALKARVCETLGWIEFPARSGEFHNYQSLRTHDLNVLLDFSGIHNRVRSEYRTAWEVVGKWAHNWRYLPVESASESACFQIIDAVALLLEVI